MWTLSDNGYEFIKNVEGYKNKAYKINSEKYYTCCIGHHGPDVQNRTYTDEECKNLFEKDKVTFEKAANQFLNIKTQSQFDALFSLCYNCGPAIATPGKAIYNAMRDNLHIEDADAFRKKWLSYRNCNGKLHSRRSKELELFYSNASEPKNEQ